MKHRTEPRAAPLRPAVRALAVAVLMLGALVIGAFPSHADTSATPPPSLAFGANGPTVCPYHASSPLDAQGGPAGGCAVETGSHTPSTVPPIPPALTVPVGWFVPPWLVDPDGTGPALAAAETAVVTDLDDLCVSLT